MQGRRNQACWNKFVIPPEGEAGDQEFKACLDCMRPSFKRSGETDGAVSLPVECLPACLVHIQFWGLRLRAVLPLVGSHTPTIPTPKFEACLG